jgi:electron transfer flavoprotein alpha subunit
MPVLLIAQHDGAALDKATLHALTAARQLGEVHILVAGAVTEGAAKAAAEAEGVAEVLVVTDAALESPVAETLGALVVKLAADYDAVLAASTTFGKNLMPRVAALLDVAQVSDIVEVLGPDTFKRYIYAGNALATVKSANPKQVLTVRTTAFEPTLATGGAGEIVGVPFGEGSDLAQVVGREVSRGERPDLTSARVVVSGGRAMGSADNFKLIEELAEALGAGVGASRAAVDAGYAPNDWQVGQTGKIVAPELYVAVGISGAIQHLAGMKDSKVIVAINKDEEAPMFQVADYGLVGDLFKIVPELTDAIKRAKG